MAKWPFVLELVLGYVAGVRNGMDLNAAKFERGTRAEIRELNMQFLDLVILYEGADNISCFSQDWLAHHGLATVHVRLNSSDSKEHDPTINFVQIKHGPISHLNAFGNVFQLGGRRRMPVSIEPILFQDLLEI